MARTPDGSSRRSVFLAEGTPLDPIASLRLGDVQLALRTDHNRWFVPQ